MPAGQRIPFHHAQINAAPFIQLMGSLFSPSTANTTAGPALGSTEVGAGGQQYINTMSSTGNPMSVPLTTASKAGVDTMGALDKATYNKMANPAPVMGYEGHPIRALMDYLLAGGQGHTASNAFNAQLQASDWEGQQASNRQLDVIKGTRQNYLDTLPKEHEILTSAEVNRRNAIDPLDVAKQTSYDQAQAASQKGMTVADWLKLSPEIQAADLAKIRADKQISTNAGNIAAGAAPYAQELGQYQGMGQVQAARGDYFKNQSTANAFAANPNYGNITLGADIAGKHLATVKDNQMSTALAANPSFTWDNMKQQLALKQAEEDSMRRVQLNPGSMNALYGRGNVFTGSVFNPAQINPMLGAGFTPIPQKPILTGSANPPLPEFPKPDVEAHNPNNGTPAAPTSFSPVFTPNVPAYTVPDDAWNQERQMQYNTLSGQVNDFSKMLGANASNPAFTGMTTAFTDARNSSLADVLGIQPEQVGSSTSTYSPASVFARKGGLGNTNYVNQLNSLTPVQQIALYNSIINKTRQGIPATTAQQYFRQ